MREVMDNGPMRGRIVIGEGARDEAHAKSERSWGPPGDEELRPSSEVDIAVDPIEGRPLALAEQRLAGWRAGAAAPTRTL